MKHWSQMPNQIERINEVSFYTLRDRSHWLEREILRGRNVIEVEEGRYRTFYIAPDWIKHPIRRARLELARWQFRRRGESW